MDHLEQIENVGAKREGNRNFPHFAHKREVQCKNICITVNNYNLEQIDQLTNFFKICCDKYILAKEIGEQGTPHLQGAFVLKRKDRFSSIFKKLKFTCHLEKMIGNWKQQVEYCSKEGDIIINYSIDYDDIPIKCLKDEDLYQWQKDIMEFLKLEPDDRTINWFWEDIGGVGKSQFTKYLGMKHNARIIQKGNYSDIMNHVFLASNMRIFVVDVPRSSGHNVSYNALESIKSGIIFNSKYETGQKFINCPHILVFANTPPDREQMSSDRWNVVDIRERYYLDKFNNI